MNFTTKQYKKITQLLQLKWHANCDPPRTVLPSAWFKYQLLLWGWFNCAMSIFENAAVKIFEGKDFLKGSKVLKHAAKMSLLMKISVLSKDIKLHARAGWDCEMLKDAQLVILPHKKWVCFNCKYEHFSHCNELFLRNFENRTCGDTYHFTENHLCIRL